MKRLFYLLVLVFLPSCVFAISVEEVMVIVNADVNESVEIGRYYCRKRGIDEDNILRLSLGCELAEMISREDYNSKVACVVREKLESEEFKNRIRCLVTVYGLPLRVGGRGMIEQRKDDIKRYEKEIELKKDVLKALENLSENSKSRMEAEIRQINAKIDYIRGKNSDAALDSELSMVLFGDYELYMWAENTLYVNSLAPDSRTMMVSRLDGPGVEVIKSMIDKAIVAEKQGLKGSACFDYGYSQKGKGLFDVYDNSIREAAELVKLKTELEVIENTERGLFGAGECPDTVLYCGWYSVREYVDAFDFNVGAVGYHIASWEAQNLRDPEASNWCAAMLVDGITATLGAVSEPYLQSFPRPVDFFGQLIEGKSLVEAFYLSKPFNSWQLILIGDPLYVPFKQKKSRYFWFR